jgi:hypothetical protein
MQSGIKVKEKKKNAPRRFFYGICSVPFCVLPLALPWNAGVSLARK